MNLTMYQVEKNYATKEDAFLYGTILPCGLLFMSLMFTMVFHPAFGFLFMIFALMPAFRWQGRKEVTIEEYNKLLSEAKSAYEQQNA